MRKLASGLAFALVLASASTAGSNDFDQARSTTAKTHLDDCQLAFMMGCVYLSGDWALCEFVAVNHACPDPVKG